MNDIASKSMIMGFVRAMSEQAPGIIRLFGRISSSQEDLITGKSPNPFPYPADMCQEFQCRRGTGNGPSVHCARDVALQADKRSVLEENG